MAFKASKGFTAADDFEDAEPVEFELSWRLKADRSKTGTEVFTCVDQIPMGNLVDLEGNAPGAGYGLIIGALLDDDYDLNDDGIIEGTSSYERYQALTHDTKKETPAAELRDVLQFLYNEYTERRNPSRAAGRPTTPSEPSAARSTGSGRSSTDGRPRKASTSGRARRTVA